MMRLGARQSLLATPRPAATPHSRNAHPRPSTAASPRTLVCANHRHAPPCAFPAAFSASQPRHVATAATVAPRHNDATFPPDPHGSLGVKRDITPLQEYDQRVALGRLRNDEHQREIIKCLETLHQQLRHYRPPPVHPTVEFQHARKSLWSSLLSITSPLASSSATAGAIPANIPKGLYLYGDVGSGKTMLMDLFYHTLPANVRSKLRIHFHNFMQDVHRRLHRAKLRHGYNMDAVPLVAADIAASGSVLCFDEFQCTDVADAMILRRLLEALMAHGVVLVTTSNRHPDELYRNGIQRKSFVPAIGLLKRRLRVVNLDSPTDYRKMPRPSSDVYHLSLDEPAASDHADRWFRFLGHPADPAGHAETHRVWGREIHVPRASGSCARFTFDELIGRPTGAADYLELVRAYDAFVITSVPGMTQHQRDLARRFITFIDAVYESRARLVLTTEKPLAELFVSRAEMEEAGIGGSGGGGGGGGGEAAAVLGDDAVDNHKTVGELMGSSLFTGEEEAFAFARALSRLTEMGSREWVERGMGLESKGGKEERDGWARVRSKQMEDRM